MSRAPEVMGMTTNLGANGSLEMALLNDTTYFDPSLIRSGIGDSMALGNVAASNVTWGNIVSLNDESYGLSGITMYPTKLNINEGADGKFTVGNNYLLVPKQSEDGRYKSAGANTVSATYNGTEFFYSTRNQGYGVRGIGTVSNLSPQQAAIASSRALVQSYSNSALSSIKSMWSSYGQILLSAYYTHYASGATGYGATFVDSLRSAAEKTLEAVNYLDLALRQGVIGYAAMTLDDIDVFNTVSNVISNTALPLSGVISATSVAIPQALKSRITEIETQKLALTQALKLCDSFVGVDSVPWQQLEIVVGAILNGDKTYLNGTKLTSLTKDFPLEEDNLLSLTSGAGPALTVAEYAGEYSVFFVYQIYHSVETETVTSRGEPYVSEILELLDESSAPDSAPDGDEIIEEGLNDIFGFAIDLAFRCNASGAKLLLQTAPLDRIDAEANDDGLISNTIGAGSFLKLNPGDLTTDQALLMMDSIRIGFIDNKNNLLGIAKAGLTTYSVEADGDDPEKSEIKAPLYLYDFTTETGQSLIIGERSESAELAPLEKNEVYTVTAIVWLDGDYAWNSAASSKEPVSGTLNLQFTSNLKLDPADLEITQ